MAGHECPNRLNGDVGREDEELHRNELPSTPFGRLRERTSTPEAPDDDHAGHALYRAVEAEADERDASRRDARDNGDDAFCRHPDEARPGEQPRVTDEPVAVGGGQGRR